MWSATQVEALWSGGGTGRGYFSLRWSLGEEFSFWGTSGITTNVLRKVELFTGLQLSDLPTSQSTYRHLQQRCFTRNCIRETGTR